MPRFRAEAGRDVKAGRRATHVTLPEDLLRGARALAVNVSQVCERWLAAEVVAARAAAWVRANRAGIEAWNDYVTRMG